MEHFDKFDAKVSVGDYVLGAYGNMIDGLGVFEVIDVSPKMIKIRYIKGKTNRSIKQVYARHMIKLSKLQEKSMLMTVLRESE